MRYFYAQFSNINPEDAINAVEQIIVVLTNIGFATNLLPNIIEASAAASRMVEIIERTPKVSNPKHNKFHEISGPIKFSNVEFAYPSAPKKHVLNDFNIDIPEGNTLALVGESGCGKSTVIGLLERFYEPNTGNITIGGKEISQIPLETYRNQVGIVAQEPALFI